MSLNLTLAVIPSILRPSSTVRKISPRPNRPMTATMKLNPPISGTDPKVRRSCPVTMSIPTTARMNPKKMEIRVFVGDFPPSPTNALNVSIITEKISAGPNFRANSAMIGAKKLSMMTPSTAPTPWDRNAITSAFPAFPFFARG